MMNAQQSTASPHQDDFELRLSVSVPRHSAMYHVCDVDMTVGEFQRHVARQAGLADCHLRLYHRERKLPPDKTLRGVGIKDTDFLVLKRVQRRVYDPLGNGSTRSQDQKDCFLHKSHGSSFSPISVDQVSASDQHVARGEDEDVVDEEDDEGPEGRLVVDEDDDSSHELARRDMPDRKVSTASDGLSTVGIRQGLGSFSLSHSKEGEQVPSLNFTKLTETAAEEHKKLEAARHLELLSSGRTVGDESLHRKEPFDQSSASSLPFGCPPGWHLAVSAGAASVMNNSQQQLAARMTHPFPNYYKSPFIGHPPTMVTHPMLPLHCLPGLPPLIQIAQQAFRPPMQASESVNSNSVCHMERIRASTSPTPMQSDSTTMSQRDNRVQPSALYKSLPKNPLQWTPEHVQRWLRALSQKYGLSNLDNSRFKMNGRGLALMKVKGFKYRLGEHGMLAYEDLRRLISEADRDLRGIV